MDTQLINFTIPKKLLKSVDAFARKKRATRSELLRAAIREYLEIKEARERDFKVIRLTAERNNLSEEEAMKLAEEAKEWTRRKK